MSSFSSVGGGGLCVMDGDSSLARPIKFCGLSPSSMLDDGHFSGSSGTILVSLARETTRTLKQKGQQSFCHNLLDYFFPNSIPLESIIFVRVLFSHCSSKLLWEDSVAAPLRIVWFNLV